MANGEITNSALVATQAKMGELLADENSPVNRQYARKKWSLVQALIGEQTIVPGQIIAKGKDYSVEITWPELTGLSAVNGVATCTLGDGTELGTYKQTYTLDTGDKLNGPIVVDENDFKSNLYTPEEVRAQAFLQADAAMLDRLQAKALTFLDANISDSALNGNGYTSDADGIWVGDADFNEELIADIEIAAEMNVLGSYFLITGPKFWRKAKLAGYNSGNAEGKGNIALINSQNFYFDARNIAALDNSPIYQVMSNIYFWAMKNEHTSAVVPITADKVKYTVNSALVPGITYDVIEERSCSGGNQTSYKYMFQLRNKLFLHPQSVNASTNKGIIKWLNGTPA